MRQIEIVREPFDEWPLEQGAESLRITLGLLDAVADNRAHSQRHLASELGIALGLVNAYLKRCVKKGLVKVRQAPPRRYAYYLTPRGFAEKSRLTVEYFYNSLSFFRQAKTECSDLLRNAKARGVRSLVFIGQSELAEIAALCAMELGLHIVALVDVDVERRFMGVPVVRSLDDIPLPFEAVMITDVKNARSISKKVIACVGADRVLVPGLLRVLNVRDNAAVQ